MLPLRFFLAPLWFCCCFWSVTINQKPAGPPTLMGWKIWKKEFTASWSGVAVTLNPVTKCPTMMPLKQKPTPVRKKSERLLTRAWLDLTRVSHLQQKIMAHVCAVHLTLFSKTSSFLLLTHYFFLLNSCKCTLCKYFEHTYAKLNRENYCSMICVIYNRGC